MSTIWVVVDRGEDGGWSPPIRAFYTPEEADAYCLVHNAEGGSPLFVFPVKIGWAY